jgi:hypothetical protein
MLVLAIPGTGAAGVRAVEDGRARLGDLFGKLMAEVKATRADDKRTATAALRMM